ncbi:uncharacterized protein LOC131857612 [Cryptomeria japonica]|uniref:uncharacterized protein LOC131857612 n=1 Tax=Cryptomeria japonica TaxID=3369 RepID=UPI0027DA75D8|nr:uncharacterized protein LOC131857612 [Cryptomeria japonica]
MACVLGTTPGGSPSACVVPGLGGSPSACVVSSPAPGDVSSSPATDGGGAAADSGILDAKHVVSEATKSSYADRLGKETQWFPVCRSIVVNFDDEMINEIDQVASDLSLHAVICRFKGFWPSLPRLHDWVSKHWEPLILDSVHIFPLAKGFFVVKFEKPANRKVILCDHFFIWKNRYPLMIKPWHENFVPLSESFCKMPKWVRLPNLPLHFWVDPLLEVVGDALGDFLMVDVESSDILHSTYACILVDIDASKGLPEEIKLSTPEGFWIQPLDYEGIPFRCRRCFKTGHVQLNVIYTKLKQRSLRLGGLGLPPTITWC